MGEDALYKKNIPYILTYVLAVLVVLLGTLFYRQPVLTALLLLMLLLPPLSVILCFMAKEKLTVSFETPPVAVPFETGGGLEPDDSSVDMENTDHPQDENECGRLIMRVSVENKSYVPLLNCTLEFGFGNRFYPNERTHEMVFAAPPGNSRSYDLSFDVSVPGLFEMETRSIHVTDLLHMKTWKIPFTKVLKTAVLPKEIETDNIVIQKASLEEEAENSLTGELSREIRQIREYEPGDKLRDMHWKQTARLDEPMVREFEKMRESFYVLFPVVEPGTSASADSHDTGINRTVTADSSAALAGAGGMSDTLALWYSLALRLIKQGETVYTVIYDAYGQTYEKYRSSSEDELTRTVYELYCSTGAGLNVSDEMIGRIREEIPDIVIIRDGRIASDGSV